MSSSDGWQIERSNYLCTSCGAEFAEGQGYFSALSEEVRTFVRRDYCRSCWPEVQNAPHFSFWRARRQKGQRPKRLDTAVVFDFFTKLLEPNGEDRKELCFVLALYLTRRKALKLKGVRFEGGQEFLQFRRPRRKDVIEIEDPNMNEEQISAATDRLKELFHAEL